MALDHGWRATLEFEPLYPSPAVRAAVLVLLSAGGGPMHYRDIAACAIERGIWQPAGDTPWNTLNSDVREDIERACARGLQSVFVRSPRGFIALASTSGPAVLESGNRHRDAVKQELLAKAHRLHPREFEQLAGELVRRMGYRAVSVTRYSGDGGVDVTALFPCGPISEQRFVFQVKRWRHAVGQRPLRELRGVLEPDEQGVLITTSWFSSTARRLAERWGRPIVLIDGDQLADLLIQHDLGVHRTPAELVKVVGFGHDASAPQATAGGDPLRWTPA